MFQSIADFTLFGGLSSPLSGWPSCSMMKSSVAAFTVVRGFIFWEIQVSDLVMRQRRNCFLSLADDFSVGFARLFILL